MLSFDENSWLPIVFQLMVQCIPQVKNWRFFLEQEFTPKSVNKPCIAHFIRNITFKCSEAFVNNLIITQQQSPFFASLLAK